MSSESLMRRWPGLVMTGSPLPGQIVPPGRTIVQRKRWRPNRRLWTRPVEICEQLPLSRRIPLSACGG